MWFVSYSIWRLGWRLAAEFETAPFRRDNTGKTRQMFFIRLDVFTYCGWSRPTGNLRVLMVRLNGQHQAPNRNIFLSIMLSVFSQYKNRLVSNSCMALHNKRKKKLKLLGSYTSFLKYFSGWKRCCQPFFACTSYAIMDTGIKSSLLHLITKRIRAQKCNV